MRLRQVAMVVTSLPAPEEDLRSVLGAQVCFRTPQDEIALRGSVLLDKYPLTNAVFILGDTFIELATPNEPDTPIARYIDRIGGDVGYMILVQCRDIDAARARVHEAGVRIAWAPELEDLRGLHLDPRDTQGSFLSLDQPADPAAWPWAGDRWHSEDHVGSGIEVVGAEVAARDPLGTSQRWSILVDRPVINGDGEDDLVIRLDRGEIRFVGRDDDGEPDRMSGVTVASSDPEAIVRRARDRALPFDAAGRFRLAGVAFTVVSS